LSLIGQDPILGLSRWTFGVPYLQQKISIALASLGLFALAEILDMAIKGRKISLRQSSEGKWDGMKETFKHKKLLIGSSLIGSIVGFMPGLGAAVACWMAYAWAVITGKQKDQFGKGDIRGVIAPEAANNASLGGALIPTIAFGIPGGTLVALLLSAFWMLGLNPGPDLLANHLDLIYVIIWTVALSNIIGGILLFLWTDQFAKIATIRIEILASLVTMVIFTGSLVTTMNIWDVSITFGFCLLGWLMKTYDWPRPALLLGFILGPLMERFYFTSTMVFKMKWLVRPGVLIILALTVALIIVGFLVVNRGKKTQSNAQEEGAI
jgi:TctA family transporter